MKQPNIARSVVAALAVFAAALPSHAEQATAPSVAFLGVVFQNDNEGLEPTSDAERARIKNIDAQFKSALEKSGRFTFVPVDDATTAAISAGPEIGQCNGCEVEFGRKLGARQIAWIKVQKISNLILNMNVYMADVASEKMTFLHSVDIRGNTDESWHRSLAYLLKNYLLSDKPVDKLTN